MLTESQLHVLLENMPNVAVEGFDQDGRVILWSKAAAQMFGFSELEAVGRTLDDLMLSPDDAKEFGAMLRRVQETGQGVGPTEWEFRRRDGSMGAALSTIVPFPDPDGSPRFLCVDVDVTARRQAEQALRHSEQRFRTVAENSMVGLWHITPDGFTIYINPALLHMLEVDSADGMKGRSFHEFFTPDSVTRIEQELAKRAAGIASNYEVEVVGQRGGRRNVIISGAPIFDPAGHLQSIIGTFTDITGRKHAERELRRVLEVQRMTLNELDHRVRNNLASLLTLINVTAQSAASVADFAASIRGRVHAMSTVHNYLSHTKWSAVELKSLATAVVPRDLHAALTVDGPVVTIDPKLCTPLAMVLHEFASNSMKYGALRGPGGRVQLTWKTQPRQAGQDLTLAWREQFGPAVREPAELGTGLQLVQGIVRSDLRGQIAFSFPPEGVLHTVTFPLE